MAIGVEDLRAALAALGECASIDGLNVRVLVRRRPVLEESLMEGDALYLLCEAGDAERARKGAVVTCSAGEFRVRRKEREGSGLMRIEIGS